jgi:hypothetical protein
MRGRSIPLSRPRRLIGDILYFSAGIPTVPVQRRMQLAEVVTARSGTAQADRPGWTAIFTKAYSLVSADMPALRRAYVKFPWARLYEYERPIAGVAIEREFEGEPAVFVARLRDPGQMTLTELSSRIREYAEKPVEELKSFRRTLRICSLPKPIRRALWWVALNSPKKRIRYFGTFGVSVYSALGAESLHPLSPLTTLLNYGVIAPNGEVDVRLIYDHRVLDGATVARALGRLEEVLKTTVADELRAGASIRSAA